MPFLLSLGASAVSYLASYLNQQYGGSPLSDAATAATSAAVQIGASAAGVRAQTNKLNPQNFNQNA